MQEQAVTAVASVADVAEQDFVPFYDAFIPGLKELLRNSGGKEYRMLRGKAMECISLIGVAVGKDKFGPDALRFGLARLATDTQDVRMPVQYECPHCGKSVDQTKKNRSLPVIDPCAHLRPPWDVSGKPELSKCFDQEKSLDVFLDTLSRGKYDERPL
mgnify:CR=1 FL=1